MPLGRRRADSPGSLLGEEEKNKVRVWVAHADCARIVGKHSRQIRKFEAMSGTRLSVQREDTGESTGGRYIDIVGTRQGREVALGLPLRGAAYCRKDGGEVLKGARSSGSAAAINGDGDDGGDDGTKHRNVIDDDNDGAHDLD